MDVNMAIVVDVINFIIIIFICGGLTYSVGEFSCEVGGQEFESLLSILGEGAAKITQRVCG